MRPFQRHRADAPGVDYRGRSFWMVLSLFTTPLLLLFEFVVRLRVWLRG